MTFVGTQNVSQSSASKGEAWKVSVRLQGCDLAQGYLCGSMEALNVPSAESSVITYWEGEIVDNNNYTFFTGQWDARYPKALPHVEFSSRVFHPRVSPAGELDLVKLIPPSSLGKPCLALTLKAIQHIFYSHEPGADPANPDAAQMVTEDAEGFKEEAARCVEASLSEVYETPPGSLLRFGEYTEAHDAMRLSLLEAMAASTGSQENAYLPWLNSLMEKIEHGEISASG